LAWASDVAEAARQHSLDMGIKGYFAHANQEGDPVGARLKKAGIVFAVAAENLFKGIDYADMAEESVRHWMKSADHKANLFSADVTETGVGIYRSAGRNDCYITQIFIKRALKIIPSPSRLPHREVDIIFDMVKAAIDKSKYDFDYLKVKERILEKLAYVGMPVKENIHIEGYLEDSPALDLTIDIMIDNGFIVKFTDNDLDDDLAIYTRLVHAQGFSAAVLVSEVDGKVLFPLIRIGESESGE
jgi:hypothetical protein